MDSRMRTHAILKYLLVATIAVPATPCRADACQGVAR
jgi:hypothetical protein